MLAHRYLVLLALTELELLIPSQLKYVLWEFVRNSSQRVSQLYLIFPLQPEMYLLEHFVDAMTVLKHKHLVQRGQLKWPHVFSCLALHLSHLMERFEDRVEKFQEDGLGHYLCPMRQDQ